MHLFVCVQSIASHMECECNERIINQIIVLGVTVVFILSLSLVLSLLCPPPLFQESLLFAQALRFCQYFFSSLSLSLSICFCAHSDGRNKFFQLFALSQITRFCMKTSCNEHEEEYHGHDNNPENLQHQPSIR